MLQSLMRERFREVPIEAYNLSRFLRKRKSRALKRLRKAQGQTDEIRGPKKGAVTFFRSRLQTSQSWMKKVSAPRSLREQAVTQQTVRQQTAQAGRPGSVESPAGATLPER